MRIAILDLGTNTFNLFISEILPDKSFKDIQKGKISVKLGEGGINSNHIHSIPFERGVNAILKFKEIIDKHQVHTIHAFATSAVRGADNGEAFAWAVKEKTGIPVQIISGDKEAELIYHGVKLAVNLHESYSLIMDIGGGSTEFIIANKNTILWKHSFLLGAARLLEKFNPSDPIQEAEQKIIEAHLEQSLEPLFSFLQSNHIVLNELIGSSGSFDSLAEIIAHRFYTPSLLDNQTEYTFDLEECESIYFELLKSTLQERIQIKGLVRMRVDMIVISALFVHFILRRLEIKTMRLSRYSLKEGALWEIMQQV
jgi:exopolyphosphatase / guanosine-5'-triphosphate,3'-diphosphate pyrophosphatase